ncbi:hypothetical protein [Dyadobacter sp. SG02]|uniref:hypothetical protein n=1 Tax=Dyadobacter sp. SG02 TaxID=1855291 RepID=UPI00115FB589|nr:hypothetical protein [Dyadobacter sp. SG02]
MLSRSIEQKMLGSMVIAELVRYAIGSSKPQTRYYGGYMAGVSLFMRKVLPDRVFDKVLQSQLK